MKDSKLKVIFLSIIFFGIFGLAKNSFAADYYLPFNTDIDGQTRPDSNWNSWDIGADELLMEGYKIKGTVKLKGDVRFK